MDAVVDLRPLVLVTLGMDHHPFHRLMRWVDAWLEAGGHRKVRVLAQTGPAVRPRHSECRDFLDYQELERAMEDASVVVCHAGPGSVMMCRWAGHRPIVVPRLAQFGEVVDDHQVTFARKLAAEGAVELAEDEPTLHGLLDRAVAAGDRPSARLELVMSDSVRRFEELVSGIAAPRRP